MYIRLKEVAFCFEQCGQDESNYLNTRDYRLYNSEQMQELINSEEYRREEFLTVPQIDRNEIALRYIKKMNDKSLYRHFLNIYGEDNFYGSFFAYLEGNYRLLDEWSEYEVLELINFAAKWCEQNQLRFTKK